MSAGVNAVRSRSAICSWRCRGKCEIGEESWSFCDFRARWVVTPTNRSTRANRARHEARIFACTLRLIFTSWSNLKRAPWIRVVYEHLLRCRILMKQHVLLRVWLWEGRKSTWRMSLSTRSVFRSVGSTAVLADVLKPNNLVLRKVCVNIFLHFFFISHHMQVSIKNRTIDFCQKLLIKDTGCVCFRNLH